MAGANIDGCHYWRVSILTGIKNYQKTIVTIEFTAFDSCRVRNFIKIEAFAVLLPKLCPERWQVPTLAGVKNHRKLLSSMNSAPSNCWLCKISWKMDNLFPRFPFPVPLFKDSLSDYNRFQDFRFQVFSNYNRCHILQEKFCVISMSNMEIKSKLGYFQVIYIGLLSRNMVSKEIIKR